MRVALWCTCIGGLVAGVGAQEPTRAAAIDLEPLRTHFAAKERSGVQWVAAWVGEQEPLVMTHGTDAGGEALGAATLLPLGAMSRLLLADAVVAAGPAKVLDEVACTVAGRNLTVGDLLRGTGLVPDWFATEPTAETFDRSTLLACVEFSVRAGSHFPADRRGVGEFALLADRLLDAHRPDWPAALRTRLAPAGAGVDPIDLAAAADARTRVALSKAHAEDLAQAAAAPLRLLLSSGDFLRWWRWRSGLRGTDYEGVRSASRGMVRGHDGEVQWSWSLDHGSFTWSIRTYPGCRGVLLHFAAGAPIADVHMEFETLLFGTPVRGPLFGGRAATREPSLDALDGTWLETPAAQPARLFVRRTGHQWNLALQLGERAYTMKTSRQDGDRYDFWLRRPFDEVDDQLLVWREGERQLRCVLLQRAATSVIPRRLDFTRTPTGDAPRDR